MRSSAVSTNLDQSAKGYLSAAYARSLEFAGAPVELPGSGGWLLSRAIAGSDRRDAMGIYPYLCCSRWGELRGDLDALGRQFVSVSAVADPLADCPDHLLALSFSHVRPYKTHYVIDTSVPLLQHVKRSHRETARRALGKVSVSVVEDPRACAGEWIGLYDVLCHRHGIVGLRRFTPEALRQQLGVPGMVVFRAEAEGRTVGLDLWFVQDGCAHGHLAAFNEEGYSLRASYATKMFLIDYFRSRVAWINLGSSLTQDDGLAVFKSGWASGTRISWLCGHVFDEAGYQDLLKGRGITDDGGFFPAYRRNEVF